MSSCRLSFAVTAVSAPVAQPATPVASAPVPASQASSAIYVSGSNPTSAVGPFGDSSANDTTPSLRALPVETTDGGIDASTHRKFYTLTASLRQTYDDNVNTSSSKQASLETEISPSVLVDFPTADGDFSGRYTFSLTYYENAPGSGSNNGSTNNQNGNNNQRQNGSLQTSHNFNAQYTRALSSRFQLSLAEEFSYQIEPNIMQSIGTNYQDGAFISNSLNGTFSAQLTPKVSTVATVSNTIVRYDEAAVADSQNSVEDNGSFTASYAILPKIAASVGAQIDNDTYETADRGYTSYTLFGGGSWSALPSLNFTGRAGASYTESVGNSAEISPYLALSANWTLGERSALNFSYAHSVTPSSQTGANGQLSDRFSAGFTYQITTRLSSHFDATFTSATVNSNLQSSAGGLPSDYQERDYAIETGMTYSYSPHFSFDGGISFSGVNSDNDNGSYTRDEAYVGVRGTY